MPELPEVQTVIDDLTAAGLPGRRILSVDVRRPGIVRPLSPDGFVCNVSGLTFGAISRHGKFIHFTLSGGISLLAHLRMTGQFALTTDSEPNDPHDRVVFSLDDGRILRFHDTRTFGRLICTSHPEEILGRLGPDALTSPLTGEQFHAMLQSRRRQIKALLLDQSFIAGLGNIYCDEALFAAGIHPLRASDSLDPDEGARLLDAVHTVLRTALRNRGTSLGDGETNYVSGGRAGENRSALRVYGRKGQACYQCGTDIEKIYVAQRGTHFCPACQPFCRK